MEMQVNPDPEVLKIMVWALVGILLLLVIVLGYFIRELASSVKELRDALPKMQATIDIKIPDIEEDIKDHEKRIKALESVRVVSNKRISKP
jgi:Sec-independent protein translocase protein TatA